MSQDAQRIPVTLIPGDGIGPECVESACRIVEATGAPIAWEEHEAGAEVFKKGLPSGVPRETMDSISRTRVALKGPLETPGRVRREVGERHAPQALRDVRERPPRPRDAGRDDPVQRAAASTW